jgi:DNA invertase Pin-like site-specific DNA recombinase
MKIVVYYRHKKNQKSELAHQKEAVAEWSTSAKARTVDEFVEIEGDKKMSHRPALALAIEKAKATGSTLVIAKLDRLARNVSFTMVLLEGGVDFICLDNRYANKKTVHMLAEMAANESASLSNKVKEKLAEAKAAGKKLGAARPGHWEGQEHLRKKWRAKGAKLAAKAREDRAREAYAPIVPIIVELEAKYKTDGKGAIYERIAEWLNTNGHRTTRGGDFNPSAAWRIIQRYGPKKKKQVA